MELFKTNPPNDSETSISKASKKNSAWASIKLELLEEMKQEFKNENTR